MFGGNKKKPPPKSRRSGQGLAQYGLFDVPNSLDDVGNDGGSEGDSDLEAELAAITGGGGKKQAPVKPKPKAIPQADLDQLIANSLRDIPSDEEMSDGDDDPDLLGELQEIAGDEEMEAVPEEEAPAPPPRASRPAPPPPAAASAPAAGGMVGLLQERLELYKLAEKNAKEAGETSKARRFNRGLKTLTDLLKQAKAGKPINEEDIPPVVSPGGNKPAPPPPDDAGEQSPTSPSEPLQPTVVEQAEPEPAPTPASEPETPKVQLSEETQEKLKVLNERKNDYKKAAVICKKNGDVATAIGYLKLVKQFDLVTQALIDGHPVDLSDMPGPPGDDPPPTAPAPMPQKEEEHVQQSTDTPSDPSVEEPPQGLITASTVEEALQQRLQLYRNQESASNDAGNTSKARRMGRIVKQFEQALKQCKAGKPIPYDELPNPPGYAPIPGAPKEAEEDTPAPQAQPPQPRPAQSTDPAPASKPSGSGGSIRRMGSQTMSGHAGQQLTILLQRQKEFKDAALNAKKNGEQAEAIAYLRSAKGLEPLIEASKCGLPVDLSSVPLPPYAKQQLEDSFEVVTPDDCDPSEDEGLLTRLERQLMDQLRLCLDTGEHHKAMGDVAGTNRFHHLALAVKQDLDVVKLAKRSNSENVRFHYENKEFSVVQCCTDLGDNDLELTIVRGISYTVANPKEIDTYVKFEFPYPDIPTTDKTPLVKDTNSPDYDSVFNIQINRQARPCMRIFKRQAVKLEVYSRGCCGRPCSCPFPFFSGFFTRDSLVGTVLVKLQPLETQTILHDSFDLMNGRKVVGGKLEVKIRIRHPILTKQVEQTSRKWLVIDH